MLHSWPRETPPSRPSPNIQKIVFYSLYATLPWAKHVCTRFCVYATHVYVLKHLKKLKLLNFRQRSWVLPADYVLVPVAQLFPTNSQLKNYFGRSIKRLQWEGLREERIERKITLLRFSLTKSKDPYASNTSPICRKPLFPCVMMSFYLRDHGVSHGRSLLKAWDWTNPEDGSAWSPRKDESGEIIPFCTLVIYNKRNTCLVPDINLLHIHDVNVIIHMWMVVFNGITNFLSLCYEDNFFMMLGQYTVVLSGIIGFAGWRTKRN